MREPQRIEVASHTATHADIEQRLHWADDFGHKNALLDHILTSRDIDQALVFTSTQQDADALAWKLGDKSDDPVANYLADIFTLPASLAGLPGLSLPVGFGAGGMPVGMQLIGNYLQEARLLNVAHRYQQATDWHTRQPGATA